MVGLVLKYEPPATKPATSDGLSGPVTVRKGMGETVFLKPHSVLSDGRRIGPSGPVGGDADVWVVTLDGGRIQIACTEQR
jgi:hypothetical protein